MIGRSPRNRERYREVSARCRHARGQIAGAVNDSARYHAQFGGGGVALSVARERTQYGVDRHQAGPVADLAQTADAIQPAVRIAVRTDIACHGPVPLSCKSLTKRESSRACLNAR